MNYWVASSLAKSIYSFINFFFPKPLIYRDNSESSQIIEADEFSSGDFEGRPRACPHPNFLLLRIKSRNPPQ